MYVCVSVCTHVRMYLYMYFCIYVHKLTRMYTFKAFLTECLTIKNKLQNLNFGISIISIVSKR